MDFTGKVTHLDNRNGNNWTIQDVRIEETEGNYPESVYAFIYGEDNIAKAALKVGDVITARISCTTREFNGKIFNSLKIWKVERVALAAQPQAQAQPTQQAQAQIFPSQQPKDDLPF